MAAATAFFTFFALPSITVILSQVLSLLFADHRQLVSGRLFGQLTELFGPQSARQLQDISQRLQPSGSDIWPTLGSVAFLLLTATTLFAVIKNSLNQLWNVKPKDKRTAWSVLRDRTVALAIIIGSGLLFTASVTVNQALPATGFWAGVGRHLTSVMILAIWFAALFKYLPDVRVRWSAVGIGALITGVLFLLGELILTQLLTYQQLRSVHGTAGSLTLVLLFVFYSSLIMYYGAAFTRQFVQWADLETTPTSDAVTYVIHDVPENDPDS